MNKLIEDKERKIPQTVGTDPTHSPQLKKNIVNLVVKCTKNNMRFTLINLKGDIIYTLTPGRMGYRKRARKLPINIYETTHAFCLRLKDFNLDGIQTIYFKGISRHRNQFLKAFKHHKFYVLRISDITSYPFNGCRPRKARRLKRRT